MSDLLDRIRAAQVNAGERVVMDDLRSKGLLDIASGDMTAELLVALKRAARELEMYIDLQQKLDYIEYAARSQKELDAINAVIVKAERSATG